LGGALHDRLGRAGGEFAFMFILWDDTATLYAFRDIDWFTASLGMYRDALDLIVDAILKTASKIHGSLSDDGKGKFMTILEDVNSSSDNVILRMQTLIPAVSALAISEASSHLKKGKAEYLNELMKESEQMNIAIYIRETGPENEKNETQDKVRLLCLGEPILETKDLLTFQTQEWLGVSLHSHYYVKRRSPKGMLALYEIALPVSFEAASPYTYTATVLSRFREVPVDWVSD